MNTEGNVERSEILPLLGKVRKQGGDILAYCPVHADGTKHNGRGGESLVLHSSGVLKCYAGCSFADVMAKLREASKERPVEQRQRGAAFTMVKAYEYRTPTGELVGVKGRFERPDPEGGKAEKSFRWRLPEGTYEAGLGGLRMSDMPLWGADSLGGVPIDQRIWFAEGESATEAIRARNEIALCGPWGASQREFGDAFNVLAGRDVILWPDNDPPGRDYMAAVRKHLLPMARSVAVVTAPVPPKGDAVEYFQAGGTVDDLLTNVVTRPTVDVLASDHFIVRVPSDSGPVAFDFSRVTKTAGAMDCELTVTHLSPVAEREPYAQRINLLSGSARATLERALGAQFGKDGINWTTALSTAYSRVRATFLEMDRAMQIGSLPEMSRPTFLVDTLLPEGQPTIVFGDGSSGKTMISYALGLSVALGGDFCGLSVKQGGVLVLDYETTGATARFRFRRLLSGLGVDAALLTELPIHYMSAMGIPLPDLVDALEKTVRNKEISLLIIDSAGAACPGKPEDSVAALAYFNALNRLGVTTLTIAHVNRADAAISSYRPFGCYSDDTEVLTWGGWKRHEAVREGDLVLAFDPDTGATEWAPVQKVWRYDYAGQMIHFRGGSLDMLVTPNHRMVVKPGYRVAGTRKPYRNSRHWHIREAADITTANWLVPYASPHANGFEDANPDFMRFLGWWLSEGTFNSDAPVLTQAEGPLAAEMRAVVERLGFDALVWIGGRATELPCMQLRLRKATALGRWLREECGSHAPTKRIPTVAWETGHQSLQALFTAMMEGDGTWRTPTRGLYSTSSHALADDFQRLAIRLGWSASVVPLGRARSHHHDRYVVRIGRRPHLTVKRRNTEEVDYQGPVWCLTVPTGAYVTRRNGRMGIAGNSAFWHNMARRTWFVRRDTEEESDEVDVGLLCRKVNDGRWPKPISWRMSFRGETGPITFRQQAFRDVAAFDDERSVWERVYEYLVQNPESTIAEISGATGLANDSVRRELYRGKDKGRFVHFSNGTGKGHQARWGAGTSAEEAS